MRWPGGISLAVPDVNDAALAISPMKVVNGARTILKIADIG
jgi:hypothetical protein